MRNTLLKGSAGLGLALTPAQADTLCAYGEAMLEKNKVMNLTAIKEPEAVAELHFLDSLTLLSCADFAPGAKVIDVGCGAGLPGVPLKIAAPVRPYRSPEALLPRSSLVASSQKKRPSAQAMFQACRPVTLPLPSKTFPST